LLLLLASAWAFSLKEPFSPHLQPWDLANGLALLGAAWLLGESHAHPHVTVLAGGVLLSESVALASQRWRPDLSNCLFTLWLLGLSSLTEGNDLDSGLILLAGLVAAVRGLGSARMPVMLAGILAFLKVTDGQLSSHDVSFKVRLLPLAVLLIAMSFFLLARPAHPSRDALGFHPLASLRLGIALLALPPLLSLAVFPDLTDFVWVLAVGCACLAVSQGFSSHPELRSHLKQSGGWVLTGWAAVSLGRAAMVLPWQLATLVVGLVLVAAGIKAEKSRKGRGD
jgi:hypothetical protein